MLNKAKPSANDGRPSFFYHFAEEDQKEQLQIFVDWLHQER
ncbi:unnamed protein product, partial [Choristocarpus tenellus]